MDTLLIKLPWCLFKILCSILLRFLWAHKKTRIKYNTLLRIKEHGAMGLPNLRDYYLASHLTRIIDWHCHQDTKDWVNWEMSLNPIPLKFTPWIPWLSYPVSIKQHPLTGITLNVIHGLAKEAEIPSSHGPLTPLKDNPDFFPCMGNLLFRSLLQNKLLLARDCFQQTNIKDFPSLKIDNNLTNLPFWAYLQLRSYHHKK